MDSLENFKQEKLTIDLVWANIFGIIIFIPTILIFGLPFYLIWGDEFNAKKIIDNLGLQGLSIKFIIIFSAIILGIIAHELIHGITWARYTEKGFKSIKFGVIWKMLTPYCHCKEPLKVKQYIIGAIAPAILLGILPSFISIIIGHSGLLAFGIFFTASAAGDILMINLIRKENKDDLVQDHPSEVGCYIYRKIE